MATMIKLSQTPNHVPIWVNADNILCVADTPNGGSKIFFSAEHTRSVVESPSDIVALIKGEGPEWTRPRLAASSD